MVVVFKFQQHLEINSSVGVPGLVVLTMLVEAVVETGNNTLVLVVQVEAELGSCPANSPKQ